MSTKKLRYFGCHVSSAGGFEMALHNASELNVNTIQIHPAAPQRWNSAPFTPNFEIPFLEKLPDSPVKKVFFHGIYLINLATPDPKNYHLSKTSLVHYLDLISRIKGEGVVFHPGSLKDQDDEATGFARVSEAVDWILSNSPEDSTLLLEVSAGSGRIIGDKVEELARIYEKVEQQKRVGFALDTQHMWVSGYNWQEELEDIVRNVDKVLGLDKVRVIHLNDSKTPFASHKDRHENLGKGTIGAEAMEKIINHPKLRDIPFVLETPALKEMESAKEEVETLRSIII